eukprot:scaffold94887_cov18-Tisochrysis_lutea.AAC.1
MPASPATTAVPASPAAYPVQTTSSGPPRCVPPASDAGAGWCASAPLPRPPLATAAAAAADVAGAELGGWPCPPQHLVHHAQVFYML